MHIQPTNNYSLQQKPNFKAVHPVIHWVAESNSSYAPVVTTDLNKTLQRILVGVLNGSTKLSKTPIGEKIKNYFQKCDLDYRRKSTVRSYYNNGGGWNKSFNPISYLITGQNAEDFDAKFGKALGKARSNSPIINGTPKSAEFNNAIKNYSICGLNYVMDKNNRIFDNNGVEYALHTKFQAIRNRKGKIKSYDLIDIRLCPTSGPDDPFVKTGYITP